MCVGIPARVVELGPAGSHSATVDVEGVRREVNTIMVDDDGLSPGEWVLLHVGFALTKIDEAEAAETLAFMRQLGSVYDEEIEAVATSVYDEPEATSPSTHDDETEAVSPSAHGDDTAPTSPSTHDDETEAVSVEAS